VRELLAFEYVKTSVDKENQFQKIKSMQQVSVALQYKKSSCHSILIFEVSLSGYQPCFEYPGPSLR